jgi:hypothetical protein
LRHVADPLTQSASAPAAERFDRLVDRSGRHHLWVGAMNPSGGTGKVKNAGQVRVASAAAAAGSWRPPSPRLAPNRM